MPFQIVDPHSPYAGWFMNGLPKLEQLYPTPLSVFKQIAYDQFNIDGMEQLLNEGHGDSADVSKVVRKYQLDLINLQVYAESMGGPLPVYNHGVQWIPDTPSLGTSLVQGSFAMTSAFGANDIVSVNGHEVAGWSNVYAGVVGDYLYDFMQGENRLLNIIGADVWSLVTGIPRTTYNFISSLIEPSQASIAAAYAVRGQTVGTTASAIIISQLAQLQASNAQIVANTAGVQDGVGVLTETDFALYFLNIPVTGSAGDVIQDCLQYAGEYAQERFYNAGIRSVWSPAFIYTPTWLQINSPYILNLQLVDVTPRLAGEDDVAYLTRLYPAYGWTANFNGSIYAGAQIAIGPGEFNLYYYVGLPGTTSAFFHLWDYTPASGPPVRNGITDFVGVLAVIPFQY